MTTMTKSQFAKHLNVKPGYVTQLGNAGRLVMEGNRIDVEASVKLIAATRDPAKQGVTERHAQNRNQADTASNQDKKINMPENPGADELAGSGSAYQRAKAVKEKYNALAAKMAYERDIKMLLHVDDVRQAVMDGDTIIRTRLESLPDMLAPQLAAITDEQRIRAVLVEQVEFLLTELSASFYKLTG